MSEQKYQHIHPPSPGEKITFDEERRKLVVPHHPIIAFIEGDGIGIDVAPVMRKVVDTAVAKAYHGQRAVAWLEIYAGEKATQVYGDNQWLPEETFAAIREYKVAIKGPLTTPVAKGMRSLNVAIRQVLDLYACIRPIRYFPGTPTPMRHSDTTDMVVFRENTEDIYAGIEWPIGSKEVQRLIRFLQEEMKVDGIRFPQSSGIGIKPISEQGSKRLIRMAIEYGLKNNRRSVSLVHKGNIMKYTEGAFCNWGYEVATEEFGATLCDSGPWCSISRPDREDFIIKDVIADNFLQQILLKPDDYDIIATMNLNGDYISDALAAQVGGIGIAPGANVSDTLAVFEATHGSAPKHAGKNRVNPGSIVLSAEMMLRYLGWTEAADLIIKGVSGAIAAKKVTYDLARARSGLSVGVAHPDNPHDVDRDLQRLIPGAQLTSTSGFGQAIIDYMS